MSSSSAQALWFDEFKENYRDLVRFLRRRTRCDETARDLAQDAWMRVAGRTADDAAAPASSDHARAYLFAVAERLAIDHLRRQRLWNEELAPRLSAGSLHAPDVIESHAYAQALRAVDAALTAMPARTREVFIAHRLEGVPHDELAQRFQVSRKTIEREITQAMDLAQGALGGVVASTRRQGRRKTMGALLGVVGLAGSGMLSWKAWRAWMPQWETALATPIGSIQTMVLADGSSLTVDADSALEVRLFADRREVRMTRGRIFFNVARDATRPFVVLAGATRVTVIGTRFEVEMAGAVVSVAVESGRVAVKGGGFEPLELGAGETTSVEEGRAPQIQPLGVSGTVASWRTGWLEFDHVTLGAAAVQLNRYRPDAAVIVDPAVAAMPVFARVHVQRSTQWLRGLPAVLPVKVTTAGNGQLLIAPAK